MNERLLVLTALMMLPALVQAHLSEESWGARPLALGKSYIGAADDGAAAFWNPAGLARLKTSELTVPFGRPTASGTNQSGRVAAITLANPVLTLPGTAFGLWWDHASRPGLQSTDSFAFSLARPLYSTPYSPGLLGGVTFKYLRSAPADPAAEDRSAFGMDLGLLYVLSPRLSFGAAARDVNRPRLEDRRSPAHLGVGAAYKIDLNTLLTVDWAELQSGDREVRGGLEKLFFTQNLALRGGANSTHVTAGGGLRAFSIGDFAVVAEYAYNHPFDEDRDERLHLASLKAQFGGGGEPHRASDNRRPVLLAQREKDAPAAAEETTPVAPRAATPAENADVSRELSLEPEESAFRDGAPGKAKRIWRIQRKTALQLGPDDILQINVRNHPELEATATIDAWGYIKLPFIGELRVQGLSKEQLGEELEKIYSQFVIDPQVAVTVTEFNSRVVYILGEVHNPGKYPLRDQLITLRDAIVSAGLPTERAAEWRVFVIRQGVNRVEYKHVNLRRILYRGRLDNNLVLQPGDIVFVPMGFIDGVVAFIGRVTGPLLGLGRSVFTVAP